MAGYAKGDRVMQASYGAGTITDVNAQYTVIEFDDHGARTFVTTIVRLEPTEAPAPPPRSGRGKGSKKRTPAPSA